VGTVRLIYANVFCRRLSQYTITCIGCSRCERIDRSWSLSTLEPEFIRATAEEALARMAHATILGICSLFIVAVPSSSDRSCFLHFLSYFHRRTAHTSFLKRTSRRKPHYHLFVSFEQSVPIVFEGSTRDGVFLTISGAIFLLSLPKVAWISTTRRKYLVLWKVTELKFDPLRAIPYFTYFDHVICIQSSILSNLCAGF
jgi:hypothetical protein